MRHFEAARRRAPPLAVRVAACHACALVPETSCEHRNGLLDRALLVGVPGERDFGFFSSLIDE